MALNDPEKTELNPTGIAATAAATPAARPRKTRPKLWPPLDAPADDTFATPSEAAPDDNQPMTGPEPAVFGGINPTTEEGVGTEEAQQEEAQPLGTALDEAVRGNELLPEAPPIDFVRVFRSTPFLLIAMVASLVAATFVIRMMVPTETYVQTVVRFNNYTRLNEVELQDLQLEMNKTLRTYPLRSAAWDILQKRSPNVPPGFLNSGLTFHRLDSITWEPEGILRLRVDSDDPSNDITRLSAISDAFYGELAERNRRLDEYRASLKSLQQRQDELLKRDAQLKDRIDALLDDAVHYIELKQAMQAMERYVELSDESDPLRFVARQNLARIAAEVADARQLSMQRDDLLAQRVALHGTVEETVNEIARLTRAIDVFAYPDAPNAKDLVIKDTRPHQNLILRSTWVSVIICFGGLIALMHLTDQRKAEKARRERRELLEQNQKGKIERIRRNSPAAQQ